MKNLANYFKIVPVSDYNSFDGERLITKSGNEVDHIPTNNDLILDDIPDVSSSGTVYKQSLKAVTDKLSIEQRAIYVNRRPVVVLLFTDDGAPVLWGNINYPIRISIKPTPDTDILEFNRIALKPVF